MLKKNILPVLLILPIMAFSQHTDFTDSLPELIPYKIKDKFGYCNRKMKMKIKAKFDYAFLFGYNYELFSNVFLDSTSRAFGSDQYADVTINRKKYRINKKGKVVYEIKGIRVIDIVGPYVMDAENMDSYSDYEGGVLYRLNGKMGLMSDHCARAGYYKFLLDTTFKERIGRFNKTQCIIIPAIYDYLYRSDKLFLATLNHRAGVINYFNKKIIDFKYDDINFYFDDKLFMAGLNKQRFLVDFHGREYIRR